MPLPVIADTIRTVVAIKAANGHRMSNTLHFRKTGGLSYAAAIAILDPILLAHYNTAHGGGFHWKGSAPTTSNLIQFEYTPLDGTTAETVITHSDAGGDAGDPLPASVAIVITLRTALRGRSHRGRVYQGPLTESTNTAGNPAAASVAGYAVQWNYFINTGLLATGVSLVVASYKLATAENVTSCTVDGRWDTQRRRLNV